ncbi:MAG: patatin-like phospholipase family protein [bacterium]
MIEPSQDELVDFLEDVPIFSSLPASTLQDLVSKMEWIELSPGETLFEKGDSPDKLYVVVFGRLMATVNEREGNGFIGEITRGEYVGEMGFITDEPRSANIVAGRKSYLVSLERNAFENLIGENPDQLANISRLLIQRLRSTIQSEPASSESSFYAFVPLSPTVDVNNLLEGVVENFPNSENYQVLSRQDWLVRFCSGDDPTTYRESDFLGWLYRREEEDAKVLFECERDWGPLNQSAVENADRIILVADGSGSPDLKAIEGHSHLDPESGTTTRTELVLRWPQNGSGPDNTNEWLEPRNIHQHYHVREGHPEDVERLSRFLRNQAVGIALGGGGARGLAHAGVLKALAESEIPVDYVGGTSIGAIIGALWIARNDHESFRESLEDQFLDQGNLLDYTLPVISLCRGRHFIDMVNDFFETDRIEDLPVPFFCVSTDLTNATTRVHDKGPLQQSILASIAIPIVGPPVLNHGDLLVDGGVLNNLPVDEVARRVNGDVIGVNVSPQQKLTGPEDRIEPPSPYEILGRKMLGMNRGNMPTILDIIWQTSTINSTFEHRDKKQIADQIIEPVSQDCGLFEWGRLEELSEKGYRIAKSKLNELSPNN